MQPPEPERSSGSYRGKVCVSGKAPGRGKDRLSLNALKPVHSPLRLGIKDTQFNHAGGGTFDILSLKKYPLARSWR